MRGSVFGLLLIVAACGDRARGQPDGGSPPDDGQLDAPDTSVTITITQGSAAREGVRVLFQNADSSLVLSTTTDAAGVASVKMDAGGFVTAIDPFRPAPDAPATTELRTFAGVKPGDRLKLHRPGDPVDVAATISVPEDAGVSRYQLYTTCGVVSDLAPPPGVVSAPITLTDCNGAADMMVQGFDSSGALVKSLYRADVAVAAGATLDFTGDGYADPVATTFNFTGVPDVGALFVVELLATPRGLVFDTGVFAELSGDTAAVTVPVPVAGGAINVIDARPLLGDGDHHVLQWGAPAARHDIELGPALLQDYIGEPVFDAATRSASWTISESGVVADFVVMTARLTPRTSDGTSWDWTIAAPNGAPALTLPLLAGDGERFNPVGDDSINVVELTTAKVPGGYDAVRANVLAFDDLRLGVVTGAAGTAVLEELPRGAGGGDRTR